MRKTKWVSEWIGVFIASLALALSAGTWFAQYRRQAMAERRADVTVFFHWLTEHAKVDLQRGEQLAAGYHLVLVNRGPATARSVSVSLTDAQDQALTLLDVGQDELPLPVLDPGVRYPIPWLYEPFQRHARRFEATLRWTDGDGEHERTVPLRRGQLPSDGRH